MCGIVGVIGAEKINQTLFDALTIIQHRGQDAAGIVTYDHGRMHLRKGNGLVRDVFHTRHMRNLTGNMGVGHVRYPTAGTASDAESQPFYVNSPYGIVLAHNGNLNNADELTRYLVDSQLRHLNTESDSEVLLNVFAREFEKIGHVTPSVDDVFTAVHGVHKYCRGAYSSIAMIANFGLVAFRDPHGIRPLILGKRETPSGVQYMVASESVALDCLGFERVSDVQPGEAIVITKDGELHRKLCWDETAHNPCLFEYVYLARADSVIDEISVYQVRLAMGDKLAEKIMREYPSSDIDVVIPVPDTSRPAALSLALKLGVTYREGFVKNRYIGRTFIMPGQQERKKSVRQKLNTITPEFKGKNVLLVDDSIVRGTTSQKLVELARQAGANKVYFASAAPPVRYPNVYGIDIPVANELIAHNRTHEEICAAIGADGLFYQDLSDLIDITQAANPSIKRFEDSVFSGDYVTDNIDAAYLQALETKRNDAAKADRDAVHGQNLDLHNSE